MKFLTKNYLETQFKHCVVVHINFLVAKTCWLQVNLVYVMCSSYDYFTNLAN